MIISFTKFLIVGTAFCLLALTQGCRKNTTQNPPAPRAPSYEAACADDFKKLCSGSPERIRCIGKNQDKVSKACGEAIEAFIKQHKEK